MYFYVTLPVYLYYLLTTLGIHMFYLFILFRIFRDINYSVILTLIPRPIKSATI